MKKVLCISLFIVLPLGMAACSAGQKPFDFSDLEGLEFIFSSGAGAWQTALNILPDGSFSGEFVDMNMGDSGPGYPEGTLLECKFNGKFSSPVMVDGYTWAMRCESLTAEGTDGEEKRVDGMRIFTTGPRGMEEGDFLLYLPGKPESELPEAFLDWARWVLDGDALPCYGLYHVGGQTGFVTYRKEGLS